MQIDYISITVVILAFVFGVFFGVNLVKFFSKEIIFKLENSFDSQLQLSQNFISNTMDRLFSEIDEKFDDIEKINVVLEKTKEHLEINSSKLNQLNTSCDTRKELEKEIIKLKKIIQRLERKNGLL